MTEGEEREGHCNDPHGGLSRFIKYYQILSNKSTNSIGEVDSYTTRTLLARKLLALASSYSAQRPLAPPI